MGPFDPTDRFTYWPWRYARGGEVLAPGPPDRPVQFVDARDLAAWTVRLAAGGAGGVFNATGPQGEPPHGVYTAGALLDACRRRRRSRSQHRLGGRGLPRRPGHPAVDRAAPLDSGGGRPHERYAARGLRRRRAAGLTFRPVARTVQDTLDWARQRPPEYAWRAGLPAAREAEALGAWRAAGGRRRAAGRPSGAGRGADRRTIVTSPQVAPYGSWRSPISAAAVARAAVRFGSLAVDGADVYWVEGRPGEGGRNVIVRASADGTVADVTPAPFNARTRVHEYGGGAFAVAGGHLVFAHFQDQRLYRLDVAAGGPPAPLTGTAALPAAPSCATPTSSSTRPAGACSASARTTAA